jgi:hypothetical protein
MNHDQSCHEYVPNPSATGSARSIPNFTRLRKGQFSWFGKQNRHRTGKKKTSAIRAKNAPSEAKKTRGVPAVGTPLCERAVSRAI